jgi:hypothetical protein
MLYQAFVSYSNAADGELAPALQSALDLFATPRYWLRALNVWRDPTSPFITPVPWRSNEKAHSESQYFILMASPKAPASQVHGLRTSGNFGWNFHLAFTDNVSLLTDSPEAYR